MPYTKSSVLNVSTEIYISGCLFQNDLMTFLDLSSISHSILFIENSKFESITTTDVINLHNMQLILRVFSNITASQLISTNSDVTIKTHDSESRGQEETAIIRETKNTRPLSESRLTIVSREAKKKQQ